jgi:hypothetical protein
MFNCTTSLKTGVTACIYTEIVELVKVVLFDSVFLEESSHTQSITFNTPRGYMAYYVYNIDRCVCHEVSCGFYDIKSGQTTVYWTITFE